MKTWHATAPSRSLRLTCLHSTGQLPSTSKAWRYKPSLTSTTCPDRVLIRPRSKVRSTRGCSRTTGLCPMWTLTLQAFTWPSYNDESAYARQCCCAPRLVRTDRPGTCASRSGTLLLRTCHRRLATRPECSALGLTSECLMWTPSSTVPATSRPSTLIGQRPTSLTVSAASSTPRLWSGHLPRSSRYRPLTSQAKHLTRSPSSCAQAAINSACSLTSRKASTRASSPHRTL